VANITRVDHSYTQDFSQLQGKWYRLRPGGWRTRRRALRFFHLALTEIF